jgi:hypothetical protein
VVVLSLATVVLATTSAAVALGWLALPRLLHQGSTGMRPADSSAFPAAVTGSAPVSARAGEVVAALGLLHRWDTSRAAAYASGDAAALSTLYEPGSPARTADVATLLSYRDRGFRVTGMRMQVLAVVVLGRHEDCWRLRVTDRLQRAVAVGHDVRLRLPRDQANTTELTLCRTSTHARWKVRSVSRADSGSESSLSSAPRPAAR